MHDGNTFLFLSLYENQGVSWLGEDQKVYPLIIIMRFTS